MGAVGDFQAWGGLGGEGYLTRMEALKEERELRARFIWLFG